MGVAGLTTHTICQKAHLLRCTFESGIRGPLLKPLVLSDKIMILTSDLMLASGLISLWPLMFQHPVKLLGNPQTFGGAI